jgi:hypothetical protein
MDVQSCIEKYRSLAKDIFTPRFRTYFGGAKVHNLLGYSTFSAQKLESKFRKIIKESVQGTRTADQDRVQTGVGSQTPNGTCSETGRTVPPAPNTATEDVEEIPMFGGSDQKCKVYAAHLCTPANH